MTTFPRSSELELLDAAGHAAGELRTNFRDIERVNRWLSGSALTLRAFQDLIQAGAGIAAGDAVSAVDVGCGSGDIPAALLAWGSRRQLRVRVVACDSSRDILRLVPAAAGLQPLVADGRGLPFPDNCFDVACCSMVLHHLQPDDAVRMLGEMRRVARLGVIVNDLIRSRISYIGAIALSRLITRNRLTRHDMPLSVRRAYTAAELNQLVRAAGLTVTAAHHGFAYRVAFVARSDS